MKRLGLKSKKHKIIYFSILTAIVITIASTTIALLSLSRIDYTLADTPTYEVNTEANLSSLFASIDSDTLENSKNRGWDPTDPDPNNPWNHS